MRRVFLIFVLCLSSLEAEEPPRPARGSYAVCVLPAERCVIGGPNFNSSKSPTGNCVGWVNVTQTLIANIRFDPKHKADPAITEQAIIRAFRNGTVEIIPGYKSLQALVAEANDAWKDAGIVDKKEWKKPAPTLHPVQRAVIELQRDQPVGWIDFKKLKLTPVPADASTKFAIQLENRLRYGLPANLGIRPKEGGGHAIMAVGFESESEEKNADKFYILDPNQPDHMQTLRLERLGIKGIEDHPFWVYDALSWRPGSSEQIRNLRKEVVDIVTQLSKPTNPVKKFQLQQKLKTKVAELKTQIGELKVEYIDTKDKSRALLKAAFAVHQLPTEEPELDPEQIERLFRGLFRKPAHCRPISQTELAPARARSRERIQAVPTGPSHSPVK